jgi:molybdopterin synthase sulfur carrier subunit
VCLFGPLRETVGRKTVGLTLPEGATVAALVAELSESHPAVGREIRADDGGVADGVNVTVDGRNVRQREGGATPLTDGAIVRLAPPVVGGEGGSERGSRRAAQSSAGASAPPAPGSGSGSRSTVAPVTRPSGTVPSAFQPRSA